MGSGGLSHCILVGTEDSKRNDRVSGNILPIACRLLQVDDSCGVTALTLYSLDHNREKSPGALTHSHDKISSSSPLAKAPVYLT